VQILLGVVSVQVAVAQNTLFFPESGMGTVTGHTDAYTTHLCVNKYTLRACAAPPGDSRVVSGTCRTLTHVCA
jgi:hypothetical protein